MFIKLVQFCKFPVLSLYFAPFLDRRPRWCQDAVMEMAQNIAVNAMMCRCDCAMVVFNADTSILVL